VRGVTVTPEATENDAARRGRGYIPVGELSVGFSENILPSTDCLAGKKIELYFQSGKRAEMVFVDGETVNWEMIDGVSREVSACSYRAIVPRDGIIFVDFVVSLNGGKSVSIILDSAQRCATVVTGFMPTTEEAMIPLILRAESGMPLTPVRVAFEHAAIDEPFSDNMPCHQKTTDLVGERIMWVYSSRDAYEHIYLEEDTYSWHCIAGNEKGLADTDRCFFYEIAEKLYLFVWAEKIVPTLGIVVEDLRAMRSYGKIFGHAGFDMNGPVTNFPVGSYGRLLNRTEYGSSVQPEARDTEGGIEGKRWV
jgi:hypothetical protein